MTNHGTKTVHTDQFFQKAEREHIAIGMAEEVLLEDGRILCRTEHRSILVDGCVCLQFLRVLERELPVTDKTKEAFVADDFLNPISFVPFLFHHL